MIRISATQLETFRRYLDDKMTFEQMRIQLFKLEPPSPIMQIGSLFHELLQAEYIEDKEVPYFNAGDILEARKKINYQCRNFEVKLRHEIITNSGLDVIVTGVADQLLPLEVIEFKTRYTPFTFDSYAYSMQWRLYCELFDVPQCTYKVWELKRNTKTDICELKNYHEISFFRSDKSRTELLAHIDYFVNFLINTKWDKEPQFTWSIQ